RDFATWLPMLRRPLRLSATPMNRESKIVAADKQGYSDAGHQMPSWREVFLYFLFLGFVNIGGPVAQITMNFNHMVPGPEALQLAIYVGYLKRKVWGGILAGLTFILPGAVMIIFLSWLYVNYGKLPQVVNALYVLKPPALAT